MKKLIVVISLAMSFLTSCFKRDRTCECSIDYFSKNSEIRMVPIGSYSIKKGQDKCNKLTEEIVEQESQNGIRKVSCLIK